MNLLLLRAGYPPRPLSPASTAYNQLLAQADSGQEAPLVNLIGRSVERSLTLYLEACTPQTAPAAAGLRRQLDRQREIDGAVNSFSGVIGSLLVCW